MVEGLTAAKSVLHDFTEILKPSFGPCGKDVLMKSDTGVLYLSKDGGFIVKHLEVKHPVGTMLKNTINSLDLLLGDSTKTFILVLGNLINCLSSRYEWEYETNRKLSSISIGLLRLKERLFPSTPSTCQESFLDDIKISLKNSEFLTDGRYFNGVLESSLLGKLNISSAKMFINIIQTISKHPNFSFYNLRRMIESLDDVVIPIQGIPLHSCKVLDGLIVQRECVPKQIDVKTNTRFVVITGDSVRLGDAIQNFYCCKSELSLARKDEAERKFYQMFLNILQENDISLMFIEEALPKTLQNILLTAGVSFVMHVLTEEIERIMLHYDVTPLSGLHDIFCLNEMHNPVGIATFFKSTIIGTRYCSHLGPCGNKKIKLVPGDGDPTTIRTTRSKTGFVPAIRNNTGTAPGTMNIQIILCCMSEGLGIQYKVILQRALQTLLQVYNSAVNRVELVPSCCSSEIYISSYLQFMSRTLHCPTEKHLLRLLSQSYMEVPRCIYKNSTGSDRNNRFLLPLKIDSGMVAEPLCFGIDSRTGELIHLQDVNVYEPMNSKKVLLKTLLEVSAQIIRVQHVVPVSRNIRSLRDDRNADDGDDVDDD